MKKGLSVLLIAAALFGFYGSAVSVNDILACKDYWEEAGEKSTADMNKLEDGLNQLKENEQAYLDGKDQVAEGEKTLADGEAALADGEAQYEQGLADYAAAPGKLADARQQIAKGESDLAAGEKALADGYKQYEEGKASYKAAPGQLENLNALISGLQQAKTAFANYSVDSKTGKKGDSWRKGFEKQAKKKDFSDAGLKQAKEVITKQMNGEKDSVQLIETLSGQKGVLKAVKRAKKSYPKFDTAMGKSIKAFTAAAKKLKELKEMALQYAKDDKDTIALKAGLKGKDENGDIMVPTTINENKELDGFKPLGTLNLAQTENVITLMGRVISAGEEELTAGKNAVQGMQQLIDGVVAAYEAQGGSIEQGDVTFEMAGPQGKAVADQLAAKNGAPAGYFYSTPIAAVKAQTQATIDKNEPVLAAAKTSKGRLEELVKGRKKAQGMVAGVKEKAGDKLAMAGSLDESLKDVPTVISVLAGEKDVANAEYAAYYEQLQAGLKKLAKVLDEKIEQINSNKKSFKAWRKGYKLLSNGKDQLASTSKGIPYAFSGILGTDLLRDAVRKNAPSLMPYLRAYRGNALNRDTLPQFDKDMGVIADTVIPTLLPILKQVKKDALKSYNAAPAQLREAEQQLADGEKELAAGKAKLADGKKQYAQGLADYAAAPGKLADAEQQLADGRQQLEDGRKQLEDGKAQLAQYEDGEQQVRDGLATLTGTEPDLGLTSILDRLNGDDDFDNGDNHLELDEGLNAVNTGREYQSEDGVLITDEITARAVGTAGLLGAGVLAVLAAILSFLKKNKGAGICALLAAAAGAFGAFYGSNAGTYFSEIAGSTVGSLAWIGAGVLGAVALAHAIVHFAAGKAA